MFSRVFVCPHGVCTSRGGLHPGEDWADHPQKSGWYESYWNAFLFIFTFVSSNFIASFILPNTSKSFRSNVQISQLKIFSCLSNSN